jgi:hypothetical protein
VAYAELDLRAISRLHDNYRSLSIDFAPKPLNGNVLNAVSVGDQAVGELIISTSSRYGEFLCGDDLLGVDHSKSGQQ